MTPGEPESHPSTDAGNRTDPPGNAQAAKTRHMQGKSHGYGVFYGMSLFAGFSTKCLHMGTFSAYGGKAGENICSPPPSSCGAAHGHGHAHAHAGARGGTRGAPSRPGLRTPRHFSLHMGTFSGIPCIRGTYENPLYAGKTGITPCGAFSGDSRGDPPL